MTDTVIRDTRERGLRRRGLGSRRRGDGPSPLRREKEGSVTVVGVPGRRLRIIGGVVIAVSSPLVPSSVKTGITVSANVDGGRVVPLRSSGDAQEKVVAGTLDTGEERSRRELGGNRKRSLSVNEERIFP